VHVHFELLSNTCIVTPRLNCTALHHSSTSSSGSLASGSIAGGALHSIVLGVLKQVDNLRSAVAKNALLTLGDLFQGLGRYMDPEVALSLTHVLKVSSFLQITNLACDNATYFYFVFAASVIARL
jgi:hypothetical protein